ncbi:hypothetical protein ABZ639_18200 [Saccharomonospora sp. NPDC006951]
MSNPQRDLPAVHEAWLPREHVLHRPRHGGRQLVALISALVFFAAPSLMWLFGARPGEIENHELAGFPGITSGWAFFTDLPTWATDQLVFRAGAIEAADAISRTFFGEPAPLDQGGTGDAGPLPGDAPPTSSTESPSQPGTTEAEQGYRRVIEGKNGWLYYGYDVDGKCSPNRPFAETLGKVDELRRAVEDSGRRFVFVVVPDKATMVPQNLPDDYAGKDCAIPASREFWRLVGQRTTALDLRGRLTQAERFIGKPIYYSNDSHWTDEGSVVLTREIAEAIKPGVSETWQSQGGGWGIGMADLARLLGRTEDKFTITYSLRPDGVTDRTRTQLNSLDSPAHFTAEPIEATVNEPTLIFGDSFTAASSSYLPAGFSDLTILGYPSMGDNMATTIEAFVDSEVVVVQAIERSVAGGNLPFTDQGFIDQVRQAMAARPVR